MSAQPNRPSVFKLERFFAKYEFSVRHLLCASDVEPVLMKDLLSMADEQCEDLWENLNLGYTDTKGHNLLRQEIVKMYQKVTTNDILVLVPNEGIYIAMLCMADFIRSSYKVNNFHAIATFPAYQSLYENLKASGVDMSYWTVEDTTSGWNLDLDKLESMIREDTKLLVVNFPHNPTGFIPKEKEWLKLVQICESRNILLFSDEMYRLTNNDGTCPLPSAVDCYSNAVTLSGMSKTFAMAGLRVGWLACRNPELMDAFCKQKDYLTICCSAPAEILSIIGLRNKQELLNRTMDIVKSNLALMDDFVKKHSDIIEWHRPKACTTGFMKLKDKLLNIHDGTTEGFCDFLVKSSGVLLLPATDYEYNYNYARLGFGRKTFPEALKAFEDFLTKTLSS